MNDPVMASLGRHLSELDAEERKERALEEWLETATPYVLLDIIPRMDGYRQAKFARCFLALLTAHDPYHWVEQIKDVIGEQLEAEAAEEAAADLV